MESRPIWHLLSEREKSVASLVMTGMSSVDIAQTLGLVTGTVKNCLQRIFDKAGMDNRSHLAIKLAEESLTNLEIKMEQNKWLNQ